MIKKETKSLSLLVEVLTTIAEDYLSALPAEEIEKRISAFEKMIHEEN
jgi:hypothetical protein